MNFASEHTSENQHHGFGFAKNITSVKAVADEKGTHYLQDEGWWEA